MKLFLFLLTFPLLAATLTIDAGSDTDQYFTGGAAFTTSSCPGDATVRYGAFGYHIPLAPGVYLVTLNLCETGTVAAKGQRIFSVKLNGQLVVDRLDLFAAGGVAPIERNLVAASNNGFLDLDFSYSTKSAIVSSIVVQPLFQASTVSSVPVVTEWQSCHGSGVLAGPVGPGVLLGATWPGLTANPPGWNCDGLQFYKFRLADGTEDGPYVAVKMPSDFVPSPDIWSKQ